MKKFRDFALLLFITLSISIVALGITYRYNLSSVGNGKTKDITIKKSDTITEVINMLKKEELIRNSNVFMLYIKINQIKDFKEGKYKIKDTMSSEEIAKKLSSS